MMRLTYLLAAAMLCTASYAHAHAFLERALPPVGSETTTPPHQIVLTFTEGVEPLFSTIELRDARGTALAAGKPHTEPGDNRKLVVDVPTLSAGRYSVIWHATSVDTHKTEGSYRFTITP
jgi:copper resistance protein C